MLIKTRALSSALSFRSRKSRASFASAICLISDLDRDSESACLDRYDVIACTSLLLRFSGRDIFSPLLC